MSRVSNDALAQAFTHLPREEWTNDARRHFGQGWDASRAHYAAQEPTRDEVEAVARVIWRESTGKSRWESVSPERRAVYLDMARAALSAAYAARRDEEKR